MKITRQDSDITPGWLRDFGNKLTKESKSLDNLNSIRQDNKPNKFATIEDKLNDIKSRIGFDLIKKMHDDNDGLENKTATACECNTEKPKCGCKVKVASQKHSQENLDAMSVIIKYIQDLCMHEHNRLTAMMVISRCRDEYGLRFSELPINMEELTKFIQSCLDKYDHKDEKVTYLPTDDYNSGDNNNIEAEYFSHANPK